MVCSGELPLHRGHEEMLRTGAGDGWERGTGGGPPGCGGLGASG